jgi:hypothetical protein
METKDLRAMAGDLCQLVHNLSGELEGRHGLDAIGHALEAFAFEVTTRIERLEQARTAQPGGAQ